MWVPYYLDTLVVKRQNKPRMPALDRIPVANKPRRTLACRMGGLQVGTSGRIDRLRAEEIKTHSEKYKNCVDVTLIHSWLRTEVVSDKSLYHSEPSSGQ
jgi:hypothetical protein